MSNLSEFKVTVEAAWAGATAPSDGSSASYRWIDDFIEERGNGQHRELLWRMVKGAELAAEEAIQNTWSISAELFLHRTPPGQPERTYRSFCDAIEAEAVVLERAFLTLGDAAFDPSVLAPILERWTVAEREPARPPGAGGVPRSRVAVVTFHFSVLVQEG